MKQTKAQVKQQNNKNVTQESSINEETNIRWWKRILNDDLMILLSGRPKRCHHGVYKEQLTIWEGELGVILLSFENWKHPDRNEKVAEVITFKCNHFDCIEALIIALSIRHGVCCNILWELWSPFLTETVFAQLPWSEYEDMCACAHKMPTKVSLPWDSIPTNMSLKESPECHVRLRVARTDSQ